MKTCPLCVGADIVEVYDEVDIGVGVLRGPTTGIECARCGPVAIGVDEAWPVDPEHQDEPS